MDGSSDVQLSAFDPFINSLLDKWEIPGAAFAVSHNGRLMFARGYGLAESRARDQQTPDGRQISDRPMQADSLFRIAGISRTVTAAAIQILIDDGKLSLDDKIDSAGSVRDLLQAKGQQFALLSRVIEKASGLSYADYVRTAMLAPLGIRHMQLGRTPFDMRAPDEVCYYDYPGAPLIRSVIRPDDMVSRPYGEALIEALQASQGWLASASDLLRLVNTLDGLRPPALLKPPIRNVGADSHGPDVGAMSGVSAYIFRQASTGVNAVLLFNSRPRDGAAFDADVSAGVTQSIRAITDWPAVDRFVEGPELFARDVVNAAGHRGGGVAPGEIVVMYPSNAGPSQLVEWPAGGAGGTRVLFDNIAAPVVYTVAGQISAIVPRNVAGKKTTEVVIEYDGVRSAPVSLPVLDSAPAFFTRDASGKGQAAMLNVTGCCNSARNPVMRGAMAYLFATGEGLSLTPEDRKFISEKPSAVPVPVPPDVRVTVGGVPAKVLYAGDAGVLQVNIRVPKNAPIGDRIPLVLMVGNRRSPDGVTIAVRSPVLRVLVVEHDREASRRLAGTLRQAGYAVAKAVDEEEAVARTREGPIDLIVTDRALAQAARMKLIRAVQNENPELKIVVTSEAITSGVLRDADLLGAQSVLRQDVPPQIFVRRAREILQQHFVAF